MGLSLAMKLTEAGQKVTIIEAANELGGLASAWEFAGVQWDRHYHVISKTDNFLRDLLKELDLEKDIDWVETRTGFYSGGKLYSMSNSMEFLKFPPLNLIEKFRLGATIYGASKIRNWKKLEQIPVDRWLKRWSGKGTFQKIWLPLLRAKLGDNYDKVSAAFIWATIQRMYKARRTGLKKEMFGYVPGGYETILNSLANKLIERGARINLGQAVHSIRPLDDGKVEIELESHSPTFDFAVITTASNIAAKICPNLESDERKRFEGIQYQGIVCASMLLKKSLSPYYVTNITDDWVPLTGIIEMTRIVDPEFFGGNHLIYLPKYVPADDPLLRKSDDEIEHTFKETIFKMYPDLTEDDIVAFKVSRVKNVMAVPTLNYSENLPPMETSVPGVYVINSAHIVKGNLNVNETIEIGLDAFNNLLKPVIESRSQTDSTAEPSSSKLTDSSIAMIN